MSTAFRSVLAALVGALSAAPALAEGRVYANRLQPLPAGRASAVVVRIDQSASREVVLGALDWATRLSVECYARGQTGSDPAEAVDQLLQDTWQRLRALDAAQLGVMTVDVDSAIEWLFDELETPLACAVIRVTVLHRTPVNSVQPWN
jgi:hypothetical protein